MEVTAPADANIYINNEYGASRTYETAPEKGVIRVLVQEGEKEPYLCYITFDNGGRSGRCACGHYAGSKRIDFGKNRALCVRTEYDEKVGRNPITNIEQTWQLEMGREDIAGLRGGKRERRDRF